MNLIQKLPIDNVILAIILSSILIFLERAFPFILFSKKNPPKVIQFIEKYIPPLVMISLVCYCLKDITFTTGIVGFLPYLLGIIITIVLHLWKRNSLISIFGGTIVYMFLIRCL